MAPAELLRDVVERRAFSGHEGKSGAGLERVRLADGRALVVKRVVPGADFTLELTGGGPGREYLLWRSGVLDRLPDGVGHAVVDAWLEGEVTVVVMRDLGDTVLTWEDRLSRARATWVVERLAALHRTFLADPPPGLAPLDLVLSLFAPARVAPVATSGSELMALVLRGWELFAELVPGDVADPVLALLDDVAPLSEALAAGPATLAHGDVATVNMALEDERLVLLDWAMPTVAPGALDVARFLAGCSQVLDATREELLEAYRRAAGPAYDERSMQLSLLAGLVWLGWNKALDAAEHPDPAVRRRERADLQWWVRAARSTFESGGP
ncbi:phosphotransferase family protein [Nocardioides sp. MAHUQ-72]|uniref:phosphotransferase family protein n=1 Tax=unclassified Nocardioides TaxID=2615069 RepID=UPI0036067A2D